MHANNLDFISLIFLKFNADKSFSSVFLRHDFALLAIESFTERIIYYAEGANFVAASLPARKYRRFSISQKDPIRGTIVRLALFSLYILRIFR